MREALQNFLKARVSVIILQIPRGVGWKIPTSRLNRKLADELHVLRLEPRIVPAAKGERLIFSDGLHLGAGSAEKVAAEIERGLQEYR